VNFFCEKIKIYFERYPIKLGGSNRFCQIDESKLNFNVKSHVSRDPREKIWCFGIADTTTALGYCCVVSDRTANTLLL
jgi:hypothetical protein